MFNPFGKRKLGFYQILSGHLVLVEKLPFVIGSGEGSDMLLEGDEIRHQHSMVQAKNGSFWILPIEGSIYLNGENHATACKLESDQDYSLLIGPNLFLVRVGANLETWKSNFTPNSWMADAGPEGGRIGPASLESLVDQLRDVKGAGLETVLYPFGASMGFYLGEIIRAQGLSEFVEYGDTSQQFDTDDGRPSNSQRAGGSGSAFEATVLADKGDLNCPVCWLKFEMEDIMHIAVHDSLRGDPILGEDALQRFQANRFSDFGQALDAMGLPCMDLACPHCRQRLPPSFIDIKHHIFSLVGNARAGKSYFLTILSKVLPGIMFKKFGLVWQDGDPSGNAKINDIQNQLFTAFSPEDAIIEKTVLGGAMYTTVPRFGKRVQMPQPFTYTLTSKSDSKDKSAFIFYDNAGEHFRPDVRLEDSPGALHVASASGIFFLYDPTFNYEFRKRFRDHEDPQWSSAGQDLQNVMLSEIRTRIQKMKKLSSADRISIPLAIIVGKLDAWKGLIEESGQELMECVTDSKLIRSSVRHNSEIVRNILLELAPEIVACAEELSDLISYFPVSSLGHSPVKVNKNGAVYFAPDPGKLQPMLIEVPALWALSHVVPELIPVEE